jgi:hypothetical protein
MMGGVITGCLQIEKAEVERKTKSLNGQFQSELKIQSKTGRCSTYQSKWFAFKNLIFSTHWGQRDAYVKVLHTSQFMLSLPSVSDIKKHLNVWSGSVNISAI